MKKDIHPKYFDNATFTCSCGATLVTGATQKEITVEVCSQCHPFYTGKQKVVDATGRVDRFKKLSQKASEKRETRKNIKTKEQKRKEKEDRTLEKAIPQKKTGEKKAPKKATKKSSPTKAKKAAATPKKKEAKKTTATKK